MHRRRAALICAAIVVEKSRGLTERYFAEIIRSRNAAVMRPNQTKTDIDNTVIGRWLNRYYISAQKESRCKYFTTSHASPPKRQKKNHDMEIDRHHYWKQKNPSRWTGSARNFIERGCFVTEDKKYQFSSCILYLLLLLFCPSSSARDNALKKSRLKCCKYASKKECVPTVRFSPFRPNILFFFWNWEK